MHILKYGAKGEYVAQLQRELLAQGYGPLEENSIFDEATEAVLLQFQRDKNLLADGIFGKDSYAILYGKKSNDNVPTRQFLKESDVIEAAQLLGVAPAVIKAIIQVESSGRGYLKDGRVVILFERHKFYDFLPKHLAQEIAAKYPNVCNPRPGGYWGNVGEYPRFNLAFSIDPESAMKATSWGLFQIMGFNHAAAGYATVGELVDAMKESEGKQLLAFCQFIQSNKALYTALKKQDWTTVAKLYNGAAYKKNSYDSRLANAYAYYQNPLQAA